MMHLYPNLTHYIIQQNRGKKFDDESLIPGLILSFQEKHIQYLTDQLSCNLSPENLHCDGEISNEEAEERYQYYMAVHSELEKATGQSIELIY